MLVSAVGPRKLALVLFVGICLLFLSFRSSSYYTTIDDRIPAVPEAIQESYVNEQEKLADFRPAPAQDAESEAEAEPKPEYSLKHESLPTSTISPLSSTFSPSSDPTASATPSSAEDAHSATSKWHIFDTLKSGQQSPITSAKKLTPLTNLRQYLNKMLVWSRPEPDPSHWPAYQDYVGRDYDPNRWEAFPAEHGYYTQGVKTLKDQEPKPYLPYPDYNSAEYQKEWNGEYVACTGPRGKSLNESVQDLVLAYPEISSKFPKPSIGSIEGIGLDSSVCFDRYGRYGAYGFGADEYDLPDWEPKQEQQVIWRSVKWGQLQDECVAKNQQRFKPEARTTKTELQPGLDIPDYAEDMSKTELRSEEGGVAKKYHPRTAVLIRTWEGYTYTENDLQAIRAMITELSLLSGGEYQVFLFVNVKDRSVPIFEDPQAYDDMLKKVVPTELRSISILWNEDICQKAYPEVTDWQVYWHQFMSVQWFMKTHPEFEYVWNWETDARYTGNHYHFLSKIGEFAKKQPRKYLWERNKRYYIPQMHGDWQTYFNDTNAAVEDAWSQGYIQSPVWGPLPYSTAQTPMGPAPPREMTADNFEWGVEEEADLITLLPMFDPTYTFWSYRDKIWNYIPGLHPDFSVDPYDNAYTDERFKMIPRRIFINTVARFSRKMLHTMHVENKVGRSMQAEMWPATVALQHGLKAVYAPQPVWFDRIWPPHYTDAIFNAKLDGDQNPIGWSEGPDSPYNGDREHNFYGWSWYFSSRFPKDIYRRWLGWKVRVHEWGEPERLAGGIEEEHGMGERVDVGGSENRDTEKPVVGGRMCLPGMLLHPVKRIQQGEI
ncbi:uncharacterized protein K452DRAFT_299594 [Aplosporella prunicola CBS 121167]|uniref:Uncharacterized protein n=1 Tax=Aplosporella prunicola CBS 121167 TaxID=1176127 RepID=A0A6A6B7P0_9PEZI|nr:uncharacterized protein K452DRAFT_299594 [Aplosporella prunicola CBS 121167]KAF2140212.1 hypothetical protein K452DRAFT_299594 [Aplosporella prunicola CBS 121167]